MAALIDILTALLIVLGGFFALVGSWGLTRLPSLMTRLHGPTKATTLGVGSCLIASILYFSVNAEAWSLHELLITLFLFITAPISANMIAKAHLHRQHCDIDAQPMDGIRDGLPMPPGEGSWATIGIEGSEESGTD